MHSPPLLFLGMPIPITILIALFMPSFLWHPFKGLNHGKHKDGNDDHEEEHPCIKNLRSHSDAAG